ncbi:MAG: endonuclease/exonuclease/phosphatase family protein [Bacteroidales bacterium]|nr:endonuclease/exonuclease/phosphatase family protein [Bacteroidales bacterium]
MAKEVKKKHRFFRFTARSLMTVAAVALGLSYLSIFVNPAKLWFMTLFGLMYLPFLLLNATLLVLALLRRSKAMWIPIVALLPSLLLFGGHFQLSGPSDPPGTDDIKIVTYNVGRFAYGTNADATRDSVFRFLHRQNADIICLQEVSVRGKASLADIFRKEFRGYNIEYYSYSGKSGSYGNVTLSRFPLKNKGKITFEQSANMAVYSDYEIGNRTIRVYNCHFQSYNISLANIGKALRSNTSGAVRDTEGKMKFSLRLRPRQVDAVIKDIQGCELETFVVGDFNDTPMSYTYWKLSRGHRDSFKDAGKGFGATYSMLGPLLRLDYVLSPKGLSATSHKVLKIKYSDHYPVIATFKNEKDRR